LLAQRRKKGIVMEDVKTTEYTIVTEKMIEEEIRRRKKIEREAYQSLSICMPSDEDAIDLLQLIKDGLIKNVRIDY